MANLSVANNFSSNTIPTFIIRFSFITFIISKVVLVSIVVFSLNLLNTYIQSGTIEVKNEFIQFINAYDVINHYSAIVYIICAISFCFWIYNANINVRYFGITNLEFTPGWAVGSFFIPILGLYWPYKAVIEIWKASFCTTQADWKKISAPWIIIIWWILFIASLIGNQYINSNAPKTQNGLIYYLQFSILVQSMITISALLLLIITNDIYKKQQEKEKSITHDMH